MRRHYLISLQIWVNNAWYNTDPADDVRRPPHTYWYSQPCNRFLSAPNPSPLFPAPSWDFRVPQSGDAKLLSNPAAKQMHRYCYCLVPGLGRYLRLRSRPLRSFEWMLIGGTLGNWQERLGLSTFLTCGLLTAAVHTIALSLVLPWKFLFHAFPPPCDFQFCSGLW